MSQTMQHEIIQTLFNTCPHVMLQTMQHKLLLTSCDEARNHWYTLLYHINYNNKTFFQAPDITV